MAFSARASTFSGTRVLPTSANKLAAAQRVSVAVRAETAEAPAAKPKAARKPRPSKKIHVIKKSRWPNGIPPAMGGHLMPSGKAAPLSQSKGPGLDIHPLYFTYPSGGVDVNVVVYPEDAAAAAALADMIEVASSEAIAAKGSFAIALSGGSLVNSLGVLAGRQGIDFSKWWVFWVDERNVPHSSADSNFRGASEAFLSKVGIPASQVVAIKEGLPVEQAAEHYAGRLLELSSVVPRNADGLPVFDAVLLGVGPDGHVASLFPNRKETAATSGPLVLPVTASPKPPSERITLTLPVLNAAKNVVVVALGEGKAEIAQRVLEVQSLPGALPAQLVRPTAGTLTWMLDTASASKLRIPEWAEGKIFPRSERPPAQ